MSTSSLPHVPPVASTSTHDTPQYMNSDEAPASSATPTSLTSTAKIPRPSNAYLSFERPINTSEEERDHYKALAQEAKQKHTAERPGYKFTSAKRGTGKRALKLAAETAAAKKAKMEAPTFSTPMAVPSIVFIPTTSNSNVRRKV
ncbi:hypothetical protein BGX29_003893 [Mortierella sp. GBA35]|nr:hypothetical protein BGX29_003893 [Mortierella sp. GBA35]